MNGLSFLIAVGKPVWIPRIEIQSTHLRFSWMFFGIWILFLDMEVFFKQVSNLIEIKEYYKNQVELKNEEK